MRNIGKKNFLGKQRPASFNRVGELCQSIIMVGSLSSASIRRKVPALSFSPERKGKNQAIYPTCRLQGGLLDSYDLFTAMLIELNLCNTSEILKR